MKTTFMPAESGVPFGTFYAFPDGFADAAAAVAAGCPVYMHLHGIGKPCQGDGSLPDLQALFNWGGWNGFWKIVFGAGKPDAPGAVDNQKIVIAMVQTNSGYAKKEIQFLLAKVKSELKPKKKPTLGGNSWGGFGIINNIDDGSLDPREFSSIWMESPGGNGGIGKNFGARIKDSGCRVYLVHNVKDQTALVKQSQMLFDQMVAIGHPCAFIEFQNAWVNKSHASWANVFPSFAWHMFISIPPAQDKPDVHAASNYAEISEVNGVDVTYNFYEMMKRDLRDAGAVTTPPAPKPTLIFSGQIWDKGDGTFYTIEK